MIKYLLLMYLIFIFSCEDGQKEELTKTELFNHILRDSLSTQNLNDYSIVYILTEKGCVNCNKAFANFIQNELKHNALCVVSASRLIIDISPFKKENKSNIIFDYENYFIKNNLIKTSSIAYMNAGKLDTIIELKAEELESQLSGVKNTVFWNIP